ncbi:MAG: hypothetical protein IVW51_06885 [Thermaceae bacterium]|nr:hypothetical protein [Thermaceae bacterium]
MKLYKILAVSSLLALGVAFAAPTDTSASVSQLVQVIQAIPSALDNAGLSVDQAKALQSAIGDVSGVTITDTQVQAALDKIQSALTASQYQTLMNFASTEPQVVLPADGSNPLASNSATYPIGWETGQFLNNVINPG